MKTIETNAFQQFTSPSVICYDKTTNRIAYATSYWHESSLYFVGKAYCKSLESQEITRISAGGYNEFSPSFLNDGSILILSNADNQDYNQYLPMREIRKYFIQNQLYRIKDGKATKLTNLLHGIESYVVNPNKTKALLTVRYYDDDDPEKLNYLYSTQQLKKALKDIELNPIIVKNASFKSDADYGYKDESKRCLYLLDIESQNLTYLDYKGAMSPIFDQNDDIYFYRFNEQGSLTIFKNNEPFISCNNVKPHPGSLIVFNKDYSKLLLAVQKTENGFNQPNHLICLDNQFSESIEASFVFDFDDEKEEGTDCDCYNFSIYQGAKASYCFTDEDEIIYSRCMKGTIHLFKANKDGKNELLIGGQNNFKGLIHKEGNIIFALHTTSTTPTQQVEINTETKEMHVINRFNRFLDDTKINEAIDFESNIYGWVMKPANYREKEKYPTLLVVHGGPNGMYSSGFSLELHHYAAKGFAIIYANPIGSSGYGKQHSNMEPAFKDDAMNQLIDYCKNAAQQFDFIDIDRIGITGGSYGGFETIYACGHADFFKAGAALCPLGNFLMIANCSHSAGGDSLEEYPDDYTDYMADYVKQSPNSYADQIRVPFLMAAQQKDANCIPAQMIQLFKLLKASHPQLPVKLILSPDANHGLLALGPINLAMNLRDEIVHWFKQYL